MELTVGDLCVQSTQADGHSLHPMSRRPIDLVHLARYTLGITSHEREVLALFRTQSEHLLKRLKNAVHDQAWHDAAQMIKGSACDIGAWRVAKSAEDAEALAGDRLAARRGAVVQALQHDVDEANGFIQMLLADA